jgi:hypothetical protein
VTPLNQCAMCEEDFASLAAFDDHVLTAPGDPSFDCLQAVQMAAQGWVQNDRGRWMSPRTIRDAARVKRHHLRDGVCERRSTRETPSEAEAA